MRSGLASRLQDIPGVASVVVDLESPGAEEIKVSVMPDADEKEVLERVNALLVAYGVRTGPFPSVLIGRKRIRGTGIDVDVKITPIKGGARIEVIGEKVRSFRVVPPNPSALAQGLADAWCQVAARIPSEVVDVRLDQGRTLVVEASDGENRTVGRADTADGWVNALAEAVGTAVGLIEGYPQEAGV